MYGNFSKTLLFSVGRLFPQVVCCVLTCWMILPTATEVQAAGAFPPSEKVFPITTRAWLSVPNPTQLHESFDKTSYGQLINDPLMKPFIEGLREQLRSTGQQRLDKLGLTLEDLQNIPGGEVAFAAIEPQPGVLASVLLVDATGHEAEARAMMTKVGERLVEQKATKLPASKTAPQVTVYQLPATQAGTLPAGAPLQQPRQVAYALVGSALVVGDHLGQLSQVIAALPEGRADCLATLKSFDAIAAQCNKNVPADAARLRWYVDPLGYAKVYQTANPPREKRKGPDYVSIIARQGFDAVQAAGGILILSAGDHEICHHSMIYAPPLEGREALAPDRFDLAARMLQFPNSATIEPPAWVPREVASWGAMQWDIQTAFASVESLVDDIVGEKGVFDDVIASLKEDPDGPQIDVEKDLVACLGKRVSIVSDSVMPINTDSDRLVIAIEAVDAEKVAATVAKSMATDPDMKKVEFKEHVIWELIDRSSAIPKLEIDIPGGSVPHADEEDGGAHSRPKLRESDEKLLPHSAVTVAKGHLLIASHRDFLERVLESSDDSQSLSDAVDYTAMNKAIAQFFPSQLALRSFGRADRSIRPLYEMLKKGEMPKSKSVMGQVLNGVLGEGKEKKDKNLRQQKIDGSTLPDFALVSHYFGTLGAGMESLPNGWYMVGIALPKAKAKVDAEAAQ